MKQEDVLRKLRAEKSKLLRLAKQKRAAEMKKKKAEAEEKKLRAEISKLKSEVSLDIKKEANKVARKISKKDVPLAKKRAKTFLKGINRGLDNLQKFANKYG